MSESTEGIVKAQWRRPKFSLKTLMFLVLVCCVTVWVDPFGWKSVPLYVATMDISINEQFDAKNVRLEHWPANRVPDEAVRNLEEFDERYARARVYAGEPVLRSKLMKQMLGSFRKGSPSIGPPNEYRAVMIKVPIPLVELTPVEPGDRVELMLAGAFATRTRTILEAIKVFSVENETQPNPLAEDETGGVRTVIVLMKPRQAEEVMLASELGELRVRPCVTKPLWRTKRRTPQRARQ